MKRRLYLNNEEKNLVIQRLRQVEQDPIFKITRELLINLSCTLSANITD